MLRASMMLSLVSAGSVLVPGDRAVNDEVQPDSRTPFSPTFILFPKGRRAAREAGGRKEKVQGYGETHPNPKRPKLDSAAFGQALDKRWGSALNSEGLPLDPALEAALSVSACRPRTQHSKGYGTLKRSRQDKLSEIAA